MRKHIMKRKLIQRILLLFLASAVFMGESPMSAFAAERINEVEYVTADDGLINPLIENLDVSVSVYGADSNTDKSGIKAYEELRDFMNKYVEPEYFLEYGNLVSTTKKKQLQILKKEAEKATANAKTQYEKIKAITLFVAERVYYDGVSKVGEWYTDPYEVYKYKRAVCGGYAILMATLCKSVGIPCMVLNIIDEYLPHAFNAIYDSDNKKWMFVDASLCTGNFYAPGGNWIKRPPNLTAATGFDRQPENLWAGGMIYGVGGVVDPKNDSAYYSLVANHMNTDKWYLRLSGAKKKNIKASAEIGGYPVRSVSWKGYKTEIVQTLDLSKTQITSIDASTFYKSKNLTKVIFPVSLTKIDTYAFSDCDNLKTVDLSNTKITVIGDNAFSDCDKLKSVDLSNTKLKKIMYFAFKNCYALRTIKLPTTLKTIANQAFCTTDRSKKYPLTVITRLPKKKLKLSNQGIWDERKVKVCGAYTIYFEGNGAEKGTMSNLLCGRDMKTALSSNKFKRSGYRFVGWSKKKNGKGKIYKNKEKVKNLAKKNKTVKLYAVWKKL